MTITEKVAYLKGLSDGLGIDTEKSKEGKLISVIIDILEEMGMSIEDLEENATALGEELDAVSDDLADVEEFLYGEDEDEDDEDYAEFESYQRPYFSVSLSAARESSPRIRSTFALAVCRDRISSLAFW